MVTDAQAFKRLGIKIMWKRIFMKPILIFVTLASGVFAQAGLLQNNTSQEATVQQSKNADSFDQIVALPGATMQNQPLTIQTKYYEVTFSPKGAIITSFKHLDKEHKLKDGIELASKPMPMRIYSSAVNRAKTDKVLFKLTKEEKGDWVVVKAEAPLLAFDAKNSQKKVKLLLQKIFHFHKTLHFWEYEWKVKNLNQKIVTLSQLYFVPFSKITGPHPKYLTSRWKRGYYNFYYTAGDFETLRGGSGGGFLGCGGKSKSQNKVLTTPVDYYGNASRFMLLAVQPMQPNQGAYIFYKASEKEHEIHEHLPALTIASGQEASLKFLMFSGPKVKEFLEPGLEYREKFPPLKKLHPELYKAFDFGITAPIRDLIVAILQFFYGFIPNYGVGIILFAFLFKLAFYWLNQKQADSMKKMHKIQPLIQEINEKYKDNPQLKQQKLMQVYKEHKVNPVSGCLPMILQLPIFIALYSAFSDAYELWKSPFIPGWIPDLSEPDTVYVLAKSIPVIGGFHINILPLVMTATQFVQTKMTTVSGDSQQQKVMQFMPLIMLVFFWSMPSGVVLYWTVQNLLTILQQWITDIRSDENSE
ncbi:MAG: membrane protein insertase YidC [Candidatus Hydrogenedentota bacterium]|nr:MAG: membrane protein insertase YidC [Candidatus Hydrogenedentota bacterium]